MTKWSSLLVVCCALATASCTPKTLVRADEKKVAAGAEATAPTVAPLKSAAPDGAVPIDDVAFPDCMSSELRVPVAGRCVSEAGGDGSSENARFPNADAIC